MNLMDISSLGTHKYFYLCYRVNMNNFNFILFLFSLHCVLTSGRIHQLTIKDDGRPYIRLMSFGFYKHGFLQINFTDFKFSPIESIIRKPWFGFTLEKMQNSAEDPHMKTYSDRCLLDDKDRIIYGKDNITFLIMDFENNKLLVNSSQQSGMSKLQFYENMPLTSISENSGLPEENVSSELQNNTDAVEHRYTGDFQLPLYGNSTVGYSTKLIVHIPSGNEEGLYKFFFHSCGNYDKSDVVKSSFVADIEEFNEGHNYLSAGEMPLPTLYYEMSILYFPWAMFWIFILVKSRHPVYKIHYLMAALIILKSLGLLFHGINYHYIGTKGKHVATWAILYYIIHLLRGSVLFITIILIGTGWTFIKHFLSPKDKKIFMIVIPLQVFANIAEIIIEESEEGDAEHKIWLDVFTYVDLICCFAILFPIVWSIKHLQDASQTDGKAAINLRKLKLFRHFYILVVCYIYFTRIIVYLLKMTVAFQYEWLDKLFEELVKFVFFLLTGYKFQPAPENPYLHVPREGEDGDMDIVISKCGLTEGLTKLSRINNEIGDDDKDSLLIYKRESSYDYD